MLDLFIKNIQSSGDFKALTQALRGGVKYIESQQGREVMSLEGEDLSDMYKEREAKVEYNTFLGRFVDTDESPSSDSNIGMLNAPRTIEEMQQAIFADHFDDEEFIAGFIDYVLDVTNGEFDADALIKKMKDEYDVTKAERITDRWSQYIEDVAYKLEEMFPDARGMENFKENPMPDYMDSDALVYLFDYAIEELSQEDLQELGEFVKSERPKDKNLDYFLKMGVWPDSMDLPEKLRNQAPDLGDVDFPEEEEKASEVDPDPYRDDDGADLEPDVSAYPELQQTKPTSSLDIELPIPIKKGEKFYLNGDVYTFLRVDRTRLNQKGGRPIIAHKVGNDDFSHLSLAAFADAKLEPPTDSEYPIDEYGVPLDPITNKVAFSEEEQKERRDNAYEEGRIRGGEYYVWAKKVDPENVRDHLEGVDSIRVDTKAEADLGKRLWHKTPRFESAGSVFLASLYAKYEEGWLDGVKQALNEDEDTSTNTVEPEESKGQLQASDVEAITKLELNIATKEKQLNFMKAANKVIRKYHKLGVRNSESEGWSDYRDGIHKINAEQGDPPFKVGTLEKMLEPDFGGRIGFQSFRLTSINGKLKRLYNNLEKLKNAADARRIQEPVNSTKWEKIPENEQWWDSASVEERRQVLAGRGLNGSESRSAAENDYDWWANNADENSWARMNNAIETRSMWLVRPEPEPEPASDAGSMTTVAADEEEDNYLVDRTIDVEQEINHLKRLLEQNGAPLPYISPLTPSSEVLRIDRVDYTKDLEGNSSNGKYATITCGLRHEGESENFFFWQTRREKTDSANPASEEFLVGKKPVEITCFYRHNGVNHTDPTDVQNDLAEITVAVGNYKPIEPEPATSADGQPNEEARGQWEDFLKPRFQELWGFIGKKFVANSFKSSMIQELAEIESVRIDEDNWEMVLLTSSSARTGAGVDVKPNGDLRFAIGENEVSFMEMITFLNDAIDSIKKEEKQNADRLRRAEEQAREDRIRQERKQAKTEPDVGDTVYFLSLATD